MKPISAFQTSDMRVFLTEEEAKKHEMFLQNEDVLYKYLDSTDNQYRSIPQRAIAKNSIICWELWKMKNAK